MNDISSRYDKDVLVAETSIGYTTETFGCNGIVYSKEHEKITGYPATQQGQEAFLRDLFATVRSVNNKKRHRCVLLGTGMAANTGLYVGK